MKHYKEREMSFGYFVGNFKPAAFETENVEIAIKYISVGTLDAGYYREKDTQLIYICSGKIEVNRQIFQTGDIVVFEPGDMINMFAIDDAKIMIAKFPGTKGDILKYEWKNYDELDSFYSYFLERLKFETVELQGKPIINSSNIEFKDISVVVQGYIENITSYVLKSIRKYLPGATIILSTWKDCVVDGLDYDELVLNDDPGTVDCSLWDDIRINNNGNRQIYSTQMGVKIVKTKYTLKLRSDLLLLGNGFLDYFDVKTQPNEKYGLFDNKLIIGELYTRHKFVYHRDGERFEVPKPFHPSDWFVFGTSKDVKHLYDSVELIPDNELHNYVCKYPDIVKESKYKYSWRYTTEQHIFLSSVRKQIPTLSFEDWTDWNAENIMMSEKLMNENFTVLNLARHNILNMKYVTASFANNDLRHPEEQLYICKEK